MIAMDWRDKVRILSTLHRLLVFRCSFFTCMLYMVHMARGAQNRRRKRYNMIARMDQQSKHMERLFKLSDADCIANLRMDRRAFFKLCCLLQQGGIRNKKYVTVDEQVAMFLSVLAHHGKNRKVGCDFERSGHTVSTYFNSTLNSLIRIFKLLLAKPEPVVATDEESDTWKCFQGCLGALDGTYIKVTVSTMDKPKYITSKGETAVNVLAVCDRNMKFTYILSGWEGSASNSTVLCNAVTRENGLKVPAGNYYLCDSSYPNEKGFLTPYRGKRYHLKDYEKDFVPKDYQEYFNMKHCKAMKVIKRAFNLLKKRWGILRSSTRYPIKVQNHIIMGCALLENFIRMEMPVDPLEDELEDTADETDDMDEDFAGFAETSSEWSNWRDSLAQEMFNTWQANW